MAATRAPVFHAAELAVFNDVVSQVLMDTMMRCVSPWGAARVDLIQLNFLLLKNTLKFIIRSPALVSFKE